MTTTVTVRTHNKAATVKQVYPGLYDCDTLLPTTASAPVTVPPESEMTFYVHDAMDILVTEASEE